MSVAEPMSTPRNEPRPGFATRVPRAPPRPASVKINVEGAFIVNEPNEGNGCKNGNGVNGDYVRWEHKDIRLPHHTDVVSHIAVDVSGMRNIQRHWLIHCRLADR